MTACDVTIFSQADYKDS